MSMFNEELMVERREVRERFVERVSVLDKVKELLCFPNTEYMTITQVAEYYGVPYNTVATQYKCCKEEFTDDGVYLMPFSEFKDIIGNSDGKINVVYTRGNMRFSYGSVSLIIPNRGVKVFPKRAVLRMGMLLRDSEIAKELRTQLLNSFDNSTEDQHIADIDKEKKIMDRVMTAFSRGDNSELMLAMQELDKFRKRCIKTLEDRNSKLEQETEILSGNAYKWSDRASLLKIVRTMAGSLGMSFAKAYTMLYDELLYKHKICLSARGAKPYTQWLKDDEYPKAYQSIAAICKRYGADIMEVFGSAKMSKEDIEDILKGLEDY